MKADLEVRGLDELKHEMATLFGCDHEPLVRTRPWPARGPWRLGAADRAGSHGASHASITAVRG